MDDNLNKAHLDEHHELSSSISKQKMLERAPMGTSQRQGVRGQFSDKEFDEGSSPEINEHDAVKAFSRLE